MNGSGSSERDGTSDDLSTTERRLRCAARLEQLGVRPGISRRRLIRLLERQEGRPIQVVYDGENGHLKGMSAGTSALVDRVTDPTLITVKLADPPGSERAKHSEAHEWGHLILEPRVHDVLTTSVQARDGGPGVRLKCNVEDALEREVEMTAYLLQRYMTLPLIPETAPARSELGSVLARRAGDHDAL